VSHQSELEELHAIGDDAALVRQPAIEKLEARAAELAAAGLVGRGADEYPELGIERHGALGQETLHRVGRYVGMVLETGAIPRTARRDPDRKTRPAASRIPT